MKKRGILTASVLSLGLGLTACGEKKTDETTATPQTEPVITWNGENVPIDGTHFPNPKFRIYISENFDRDHNGVLEEEELKKVKKIEVEYRGIEAMPPIDSLKGIEYFRALEDLDCSGNALQEVDLSQNVGLKYLDCSNNQLSSLNLKTNTLLEKIYCTGNSFRELDVSNCGILDTICCDPDLSVVGAGNGTHITHDR